MKIHLFLKVNCGKITKTNINCESESITHEAYFFSMYAEKPIRSLF